MNETDVLVIGCGTAGLTAAKSHLRGALGRQVRMKYLPDLHFQEDPGLEQGLRIEAILRRTGGKPLTPMTHVLVLTASFVIFSLLSLWSLSRKKR